MHGIYRHKHAIRFVCRALFAFVASVLVLASGTKIERDAKDNKPISVNVVTMLVNPDEAERLTLAQTEGKLTLAMRNLRDNAIVQTKGVTAASLLSDAAPAATPAPRRPAAWCAPGPPSGSSTSR